MDPSAEEKAREEKAELVGKSFVQKFVARDILNGQGASTSSLSGKGGSVSATTSVLNQLRAKVSKQKRRFKTDRVDLDLTYITDRIIAMGFPSQGVEAIYRNRMEDVREFLNERHGEKYRVGF